MWVIYKISRANFVNNSSEKAATSVPKHSLVKNALPPRGEGAGVPKVGVEPTWAEAHCALNAARLPVPPLRHRICTAYLVVYAPVILPLISVLSTVWQNREWLISWVKEINKVKIIIRIAMLFQLAMIEAIDKQAKGTFKSVGAT